MELFFFLIGSLWFERTATFNFQEQLEILQNYFTYLLAEKTNPWHTLWDYKDCSIYLQHICLLHLYLTAWMRSHKEIQNTTLSCTFLSWSANHNHGTCTRQSESRFTRRFFAASTSIERKTSRAETYQAEMKNTVEHRREIVSLNPPAGALHHTPTMQGEGPARSKLRLFPFNFLLASGGRCKNNSGLNRY